MRIAVFTSNAIRHKFVANILSRHADDVLIVVECKSNHAIDPEKSDAPSSLIERHFRLRYETERQVFAGNDLFEGMTLPLVYGELNLGDTFDVVKRFGPDLMLVFGSSIIRGPLLTLVPEGHFINLHLGLSPYYRGAGTNF